jgi:putative membrane protein
LTKNRGDHHECDKLRNAKAKDFAGEYDPMQVSAHKEATSLFGALCQGWRRSETEGLGWQDPSRPATSSGDGEDMNKNRK